MGDRMEWRRANLEDLIAYLSIIRDSIGNMEVRIGEDTKTAKPLVSILCVQGVEDQPFPVDPVLYLTSTNAITDRRYEDLRSDQTLAAQPIYLFKEDA